MAKGSASAAKQLRELSKSERSELDREVAELAWRWARRLAGLALAESGVAVSKANLEEAEANLGYTTIRSPGPTPCDRRPLATLRIRRSRSR